MLPADNMTGRPPFINVGMLVLRYHNVSETLLGRMIISGIILQFIQTLQIKNNTSLASKYFQSQNNSFCLLQSGLR